METPNRRPNTSRPPPLPNRGQGVRNPNAYLINQDPIISTPPRKPIKRTSNNTPRRRKSRKTRKSRKST